jgi:hypothetical protein
MDAELSFGLLGFISGTFVSVVSQTTEYHFVIVGTIFAGMAIGNIVKKWNTDQVEIDV